MTCSRRRTRRRSESRSPIITVSAILIVVALVVGVSLPASSFTHGELPRSSGVNVTSDENAALGLDTAQTVYINDTSNLVTVTNQLGNDVTITVTLRDDSTHIGDLVVDGETHGNETSFSLARGSTETVRIQVPDDSSLADENAYFHVRASVSGLTVKALDRHAQVSS